MDMPLIVVEAQCPCGFASCKSCDGAGEALYPVCPQCGDDLVWAMEDEREFDA